MPSPASPQTAYSRVPFKEVASYTMGAVGGNVMYGLVAGYLMLFYTDSFGLKSAAVGMLFLIVRIWDGFMDVLMGITVDNTSTRWGKFRPYLLFGGVMTGIATMACFLSPNLSEAGKLVFAYCTYIIWSMSCTICDIPFWSLTAAMTNDPQERTRITAATRTGAAVGSWIVAVGALPAVKYFGGSWVWLGVIAGALCIAGFITVVLGVKERYVAPRHTPQTPASAIRFFTENRPLRILMLTSVLLETAGCIRGGLGLYFIKYYLGRVDLIPWFMAATVTLSIVGCVSAPVVSKWIGKVNAALYAYFFVGGSMILMYFARTNITMLLVLTGVAGYFDGINGITRMSCLADCVEYGQWKSRNRAEGLVYAANIFKTKVANALGGASSMFLLAWIGYMPNHPQSAGTLLWIVLFYTLILGVASILAILPMLKYELHEHRFAEIVAELNHPIARETEPLATGPLGHGPLLP